ncbi:MAG: hypothetical protein Q4G02_01050 [bacterium]|nr:hypothetical protein [bacterium]
MKKNPIYPILLVIILAGMIAWGVWRKNQPAPVTTDVTAPPLLENSPTSIPDLMLEPGPVISPVPMATATVSGVIDDILMSTMTIKTSQGETYSFLKADDFSVVNNLKTGLAPDLSVMVEYSGELDDGPEAHVVTVLQK